MPETSLMDLNERCAALESESNSLSDRPVKKLAPLLPWELPNIVYLVRIGAVKPAPAYSQGIKRENADYHREYMRKKAKGFSRVHPEFPAGLSKNPAAYMRAWRALKKSNHSEKPNSLK